MERIEAALLIPGRGAPVRDACVVIDGDTIAYAGPAGGAPAHPGGPTHRVPVVLPGLWDCHAHLLGLPTPNLEDLAKIPAPLAALRAGRDARAALMAGVTSVREAGGYGIHIARAVEEGSADGPTIYAAGAILSQTGGHGDLHSYPLEWVTGFTRSAGVLALCDGIAECLKAVRRQLRMGARVIKVCASGGVLSEVDDPMHQQFSGDELRAIVEEAGRADRVVMAHCHGLAGIQAALDAGCATIEHGTYLDEATATRMAEQGAVLVPTRLIVERLLAAGTASGTPGYAYDKLVAVAERHRRAIEIAHRAGVTIAMGTDTVTSGSGTAVPWGENARELVHLVAAGLSPLEAIEAATANGPGTLGPQAPRSGMLAPGYDADIIAVAHDPLTAIGVLADPANVTMVWKRGRLVKGAA